MDCIAPTHTQGLATHLGRATHFDGAQRNCSSPRPPRSGCFSSGRTALPSERCFAASLFTPASQRGLFSGLTAFSCPRGLLSWGFVHRHSLRLVPSREDPSLARTAARR